jgi:hypothetical protein
MKQVTPKAEVITNQYQVDFTPLAPLSMFNITFSDFAHVVDLSLKAPKIVPEEHNLDGV